MPINNFSGCREEARFSELLFSQLTAGWYDWTVSNYLSLNNTHCWSTTAAYYAIYILAGSLVYLPRRQNNDELIEISRSHAKLQQFYSDQSTRYNESDLILRRGFVMDMAALFDVPLDEVDKLLKELGEVLRFCKKAREGHTYEVLVVAHQAIESVNRYRPQSAVEDVNEKCLALVEHVNEVITDLIFKFLGKYDQVWRGYHFKHLQEEIKQFGVLLEYEKIAPGLPKPLSSFLDKVEATSSSIVTSEEVIMDNKVWADFKNNLSMFYEKGRAYSSLYQNQRALTNLLLKHKIQIDEVTYVTNIQDIHEGNGDSDLALSPNTSLLFNIREAEHAQRITELLPKVNLSHAAMVSNLNNLRDNLSYIKVHAADTDKPVSIVRYFTVSDKRNEIDSKLMRELKKLKGSLYFAYGSNLDPTQMYGRCPTSQFLMRAESKGFELIFPLHSSIWNGGVAGIRQNVVGSVWGVLYYMTSEDWLKMDRFEGTSSGHYNRGKINVKTIFGTFEAETYFPGSIVEDHLPGSKYIKQIINGAELFDLDQTYIQMLNSWLSVRRINF